MAITLDLEPVTFSAVNLLLNRSDAFFSRNYADFQRYLGIITAHSQDGLDRRVQL